MRVTSDDELAAVSTIRPGHRVGRYLLDRVIGTGAMGTVWAAIDPELDRPVAIKILHPDTTPGRARRSFLREAKATARLVHRNVVTIHDVGIADDRLFLAMELVDGPTLRTWLQTPRRWREIVAVMRDAAAGLAAAHEAGIVHRDFKPDNVLLDPRGRVVVTDFGLAGRTDDAAGDTRSDGEWTIERALEVTQDGPFLGTAAYAAPEQRGGGPADERSDQFSFCVTLYEALYGERPFAGTTPDEVLAHAAAGEIREHGRCSVPAWLRRAVVRGLAAMPAERFSDMNALSAAIDPGRRRRAATWIFGLGASAALVGAAIASRPAAPVRMRYCDRLDEQLQGIWDAEVRGEIEAAFLATREASAPDAWAAVAGRVDGFAEAWVDAQRQACAAQEDGSVPADVLALRMTCLQRQLGRAAAIADALHVVDRETVLRSSENVLHLDAPSDCLEDERLSHRAETRSGVDPAVQAALDDQLSRAEALAHTAKYAESETIAIEVLDRARAVGDRWAAVEALLQIAIARQWQQHPDAEQSFHDSLSAALAVKHQVAAALSMIGLLELWDASTVGGVVGAEQWVQHCAATISAIGGDGALEIEMTVALGNVYLKHGRYDDAAATYRRALEMRRSSKDDILLAGAHANIASISAARGRYREALEGFRHSHQLVAETYGPRHPNTAHALVNVGSALAELGDLEAARDEHARALEIYIENFGPDHPTLTPALRMLAWNGLTRRAYAEALPYAERALAIGRAADLRDENTARSLSMVAAIEVELGRVDDARAKAREALAIARQAYGDDHPTLAEFEVESGFVATRAGDDDEAREHFMRAIEVRQRALGPQDSEVGRAWFGIAELELARGRASAAIAAATKAYDIASLPANDRGIGPADAAFLLARTLLAGDEPQRARTYAEQARRGFAAVGPSWQARSAEIAAWIDRLPR